VGQESRSTFGKYTLLRKLASGGMGEVFLAKQRGPSGFEKLLVIKRILSHHLDKRDYLDMFFSEAKLVARLNHANIIQIQEMGEIDGDYYIAMEYVRGKSLRDIVDELRAEGRMLPLPHVIDLAIKLCEGLGYAHLARDIRGRPMNIVHRDINPHNILISYNGDLKLIDFGIAKSEMTSVHTATGTIKGKFVYMSPEQSAADPIDRRSDIFSLGIVLYEMTVLENPFVRQNVVLSLEAIQRQPIAPPSSKRPDAGPLDAILLRALEKKPEDRYQTATEMRDDLRNLFRNSVVMPAEEDVSVFLHDLFRADIEEEDRLLAEADRATSPSFHDESPSVIPLAEPASGVIHQPYPGAEGLLEARHSSDEEGAEPVQRQFGDEEPTLSGNQAGLAQKSREVSSRSQSASDGGEPDKGGHPSPQPSGQVMTLIPPDEVVPGTGDEFLPEQPTRSDRVPGRNSASGKPSSGQQEKLGGKANREIPVPSGPIPVNPMAAASASGSPRPAANAPGDLIPTAPSFRTPAPATFDEPLAPVRREGNGPFAKIADLDQRSGAPDTIAPRMRSPALTDEEVGAFSQPVPPWRRLGLWVAGLLVFLVTAVAGFVATRAVTRPVTGPRPLDDLSRTTNEDRFLQGTAVLEPVPLTIKSTTTAPEKASIPVPERAPDPKLTPQNSQKDAREARRRAKEEKRLKAEEERKHKAEEDRQAKEERRRKAEEERTARAEEERAAKEERKRRAAEEKRKRDEEKAVASAKKEETPKKTRAASDGAPEDDVAPAVATPKKAPKDDATNEDKAPKRRVVLPSDVQAKEDAKRNDADGAAQRALKDKPSAEPALRFGTLTVQSSIELNVEVDGKPLGAAPAVIPVRKGTGKIKLVGPGIEGSVSFAYNVEPEGISVKLDANPWMIAKHNGLSLGKTPQAVKADAHHRFSLLRPGQRAPLVVQLAWSPKTE
jgi:serine/threonine-protein kinase